MITEDKDALVAEIERRIKSANNDMKIGAIESLIISKTLNGFKSFIDTLEVKEVDEQKERMSECPYRQVGCTMYAGHILECKGACSWVVDYPKLKELKAQKGEKV